MKTLPRNVSKLLGTLLLTCSSALMGQLPTPLAYFDFEEGSGTVLNDTSGSGNNGTISGNVTFGTGAPGGSTPSGGGVFANDNGHVNIPGIDVPSMLAHRPSNQNGSYTFSCWLRPDAVTRDGNAGRRSFFYGQTSNGIHHGVRGDGRIESAHWSSDWQATTQNPVDTWIHVVFTYDGAAVAGDGGIGTIYVNGVQDGQNANQLAPNGSGTLRLGTRQGDQNPYSGLADDVAIWDEVLSLANIQALAGGASPVVVVDTDMDGLPDGWETAYGLNPNSSAGDDGAGGDPDGDTRTNLQEYNDGTIPNNSDSDGDGLGDGVENSLGTNPVLTDTDGDGLTDGAEVNTHSTDPLNLDSDGDGISDGTEIANGWNPNNAADPPSQWPVGLIGYWPLDGNYDEVEVTATRNGIPSGSPTFAPGKFGQAVSLSGASQYVTLGGVANDYGPPTGDISISLWCQVNTFDANWQALIAKGEGSYWRIARYQSTNTLTYAGGSTDVQNPSVNVNDGNFHHVVAVSEGGVSTRLYVDNTKVTGGSPGLSTGGALPTIGANLAGGGRYWKGQVDDLAIWDRPLGDAEVAQIYNGGTGMALADLFQQDDDGDGLPNDWETNNGLDPNDATGINGATGDPDSDGLNNLGEYNNGTDPQDPDTDNDGSNDLNEVNNSTDPNDPDSDDDGLNDGQEDTLGTNPLLADTDGDGLTDSDEVNSTGTNPLVVDTDGDGAGDGLEVLLGTDPLDNSDTPPPGSALSGVTNPGTIGKYADGTLPVQKPGGGTGATWAVQDAFPSLSFADLKGVASEPNLDGGKEYIGVVERRGTMQRVEYDSATTVKTQTLDIQSLTVNGDNGGLRTVVFHPEYNTGSANTNYIYVFYSTTATGTHGFTQNTDGAFFYRVSRFTRSGNSFGSEMVMIQQRSRDQGQHFGGGMAFGMDGMLYITWGDMEFSSSRVGVPFYQDVQRTDRIFQGAVLRIDVDQQGGAISEAPTRTLQGNNAAHTNRMAGTTQSCPSGHNYYHEDNFSGVGYFIPKNNFWHRSQNVPPAGTAGTADGVAYPAHGPALEEHVALGVRNPWRAAADLVDGDVGWFSVGSNGGTKFEEAEVLVDFQPGVVGGGNYGWPYKEGDQSETGETGRGVPPGNNSFAPVYLGTEVQPVEFHAHSLGNVAVGGVFYQGTTLNTVNNKLVNGDHGSGRIWSIDYKGGGTPVVTQLIDTSLAIRQMAASPDGEEILLAANGNIHKLVDTSPTIPEPPATLSGTGVFTNLPNLTPRAGVLPYEPTAPLWSDRAKKPRFIAVPNDVGGVDGQYDHPDEKILFSENGPWAFPIGTTFVKQFTLPTDERDPDNPTLQHKVETRFLVLGQDSQYYAFTYKWRANQTDADLIPDGGTSSYDEVVSVIDENGVPYNQTWVYPTRDQCFDCHQTATQFVLGVKTRQLNAGLFYPSSGTTANQLATLNSLGMFDQTLSVSDMTTYLKSANISDSTATLEHRVHSYLDSNCSHCHRPGAVSGLASFDARLTTPLATAGIINENPHAGNLGLIDPKIVKPGDPTNSVLHHRDESLVPGVMMPPLAKSIEHEEYMEVLTKWIGRIGYPNFDAAMTTAGVPGGLHDDDDGDKLSNVLEFILGTNAAVPTAHSGVTVADDGGINKVTIPVSAGSIADGLSPLVEDTADLFSWFEAGTPGSILQNVTNPAGFQVWEFVPGGDQGFVRVGVAP